MNFMRACVLLWLVVTAVFSYARGVQTLQGTVSYVADGDTIHVNITQGGAPLHVRIQGIDAPEICQAHGVQSQAALSQMVMGRHVVLHVRAHDTYGRAVAMVLVNAQHVGGQDVGRAMVGAGQAWSSRFHQSMGKYKNEELAARANRRGLWIDGNAVEPRVFRQRHGRCEHPRKKRH